jgi:hypothetical protein
LRRGQTGDAGADDDYFSRLFGFKVLDALVDAKVDVPVALEKGVNAGHESLVRVPRRLEPLEGLLGNELELKTIEVMINSTALVKNGTNGPTRKEFLIEIRQVFFNACIF